jgi:predicted metal-dependent hydrolase
MHHGLKMNATHSGLMFSDTKSKWGTCMHDNRLQFNWRLVMAPRMVLDYVVIHELAHTKEKNHGRNFWAKVRAFTPAYRQHRKWLTDNAHLLTV